MRGVEKVACCCFFGQAGRGDFEKRIRRVDRGLGLYVMIILRRGVRRGVFLGGRDPLTSGRQYRRAIPETVREE